MDELKEFLDLLNDCIRVFFFIAALITIVFGFHLLKKGDITNGLLAAIFSGMVLLPKQY